MLSHKRIDAICIIVIICGLILTILFMNGEALGIQKIVDEDALKYEGTEYFTSNDRKDHVDEDKAQAVITLEGDSISVSGRGAYVLDGDVYITGGGTYIVTGTLNDGRIIVDAYQSSKICLVLKEADISCSDDAAIIVEQAEKVFLNLFEGTDNTVTCADTYNEQAVEEEHTGAIFARDDLTINGTGSLTVDASYQHGIVTKDDLVITGGNLTVTAAQDALKANKNICITNAVLNLKAGDDGIMVNKEEGFLYVESGTFNLDCEGDAINSLGDVTIAGGNLTVEAGDDGIHSDTQIKVTGGTILLQECYEGLEAITVDISGGDITIYPSDDGINANGGTGDSFGNPMGGGPGMGMRQEAAEEITEGETPGESRAGESSGEQAEGETPGESPARESSGEQAEGETPGESPARESSGEQTEGETPGASPSGERFGETPEGRFPEELPEDEMTGQDETAVQNQTNTEDTWIRISGGSIAIINPTGMDADGLDSNGDIYITGGTIRISLNGTGMNNAIDYGSESGGICEINGGTVLAAGSNVMMESISDTSAQCSLMFSLDTLTQADSVVTVTNTDGTNILSWTVPCAFTTVTLSCPEMKTGETCFVTIGEETTEVTLETVSSSYGNANRGSFSGPGGFTNQN